MGNVGFDDGLLVRFVGSVGQSCQAATALDGHAGLDCGDKS